MRKIVILANNSGGLYDFRHDLMSELMAQNNNVIAYTPFDIKINELKELGIDLRELNVDRRGLNPFKDFKLLLKCMSIVKAERPDLVITYTIKPNVYGGLACRMCKVPYAINITGLGTAFQKDGIIKKIAVTLYKLACKKAKVVFFENVGNRDVFINNNIVDINKTHVLNGAGVNTEYFQLQEYPNSETTSFLFSGRIMKEKGIDELLKVTKQLISEGENIDLHILGRYEESYKELIDKYEFEGWLHYYGYQTDVRPFIARSSCFVLPSWHEGMANTNLECASSGRPVITSNINGCMESVIDGVSGYLVEVKNPESLYMAMKRFLQLNYEERKKMGLAGRIHIQEVFDKKKVVEDTISHLF